MKKQYVVSRYTNKAGEEHVSVIMAKADATRLVDLLTLPKNQRNPGDNEAASKLVAALKG